MKFSITIAIWIGIILLGGKISMAKDYQLADIYTDLRSSVLNLKPEQINQAPSNDLQIVAFLIETGYDDAVASLVAVADGTASLYFSNGGGMIGAGEYEEGRKESLQLIDEATVHIRGMTKTDIFPLPSEGHTIFYAITNRGIFTVEAPEDDFGYQRHPLSAVFHQGQRLITVMRLIDEHRRSQQQ